MTRVVRILLGALGAAWLTAGAAVADPTVEARHAPERSDYRRIGIAVSISGAHAIRAFEVRADPAGAPPSAALHTVVRVGSVAGLTRVPIGDAFQDCWSDGAPIHRDADGAPVVSPATRTWGCALTGMRPGETYTIHVTPIGADGATTPDAPAAFEAVTTTPGARLRPPDTSPILFALGSIFLSLSVLILYLRAREARRGRTKAKSAYAYVAPALLALAMLTFYPILYGVWLAFTNAHQDHLGDSHFIGLANFATILGAPGLVRVSLFTLAWTVLNLIAHIGLGLVLALAFQNQNIRGRTIYRTILLLPWAIPGYITVIAWSGMLQPEGLINGVLDTAYPFLGDPWAARVFVIVVNIWLGVPFMLMALSGALQAIPSDMYEAATLDGVSPWNQFRRITLPNLKGALIPLSLLGFIWNFNMFHTIYLLTRGNPYVAFGEPGATDVLVTYVFDLAFEHGRYGVAAAWSVAIFLMLVGLSWAYLRQTKATEAAA